MTKGTVSKELEGLTKETARTAGQRFYLEYGITGIRGQAEAGFPTVLEYGLPTLEKGRPFDATAPYDCFQEKEESSLDRKR